jgi:Asp-tRNA(Asn)/Glu-tRNA(Gln) amidotransferase A subunit family amidase
MVAAREAEQAILRGEYRGPLHGIPVAVKDQFWTKGIRSTGGSRILADFVPEEDATVITKLKQAGAVLLGKTNLTEFAITGFSHRFSTPRNPWNLEMYTGGSSSGSGAATAAFLCATSLAQNQHSCHQPQTHPQCSIREPLTLSPLLPDSGRRSAD